MAKVREVKGATITVNRRANYEYEILQRFDAGMALLGSEVKSIREGKVNLGEGFARLSNGELFLYNVHIAQYGPARLNHEPTRPRKLLLHRRELDRLQRSLEEQPRSTVIPLRMYFYNGLVKLELGLAQGRRKYDKRQAIKQREANRDMQRAVRHAQR
ncbi:MAG: SsrA-binding protein SmpB [Dehalococcoidia bacterium]|nr:SsrA-binding protein SmpB [Dehalococcoidia bacterium]